MSDALQFGMGQMLAWRRLRARVGTCTYVTEQRFQWATEDSLTPRKVTRRVKDVKKSDPQYQALNRQLDSAMIAKSAAMGSNSYPANMAEVKSLDNRITGLRDAIRERGEVLCGLIAYPDAKPPRSARPGEGPYDIGTNDQTDLLQGAEEMRLLLAHLFPEEREIWKVRQTMTVNPSPNAYPATPQVTLSVTHDQKTCALSRDGNRHAVRAKLMPVRLR